MIVAAVASLVGLAVVLVALYREAEYEVVPTAPAEWEGPLPAPADIIRTEFPVRLRGYDPASVEEHLDAVARAYADLLAVAPADVVARARGRAAARLGLTEAEPTEAAPQPVGETHAEPTPTSAATEPTGASALEPEPSGDAEQLRAEAALGTLTAKNATRTTGDQR